jgi:hypothetical protein
MRPIDFVSPMCATPTTSVEHERRDDHLDEPQEDIGDERM